MSDTLVEARPRPAGREPASAPPQLARDRRRPCVLLLVLVLLPVLIGTQVAYLKVAQYILIGAVGGIGLTLLVGQAGQLSLAHPFFLLVGAGQLRGAGRRPAEAGPGRARAAAAGRRWSARW